MATEVVAENCVLLFQTIYKHMSVYSSTKWYLSHQRWFPSEMHKRVHSTTPISSFIDEWTYIKNNRKRCSSTKTQDILRIFEHEFKGVEEDKHICIYRKNFKSIQVYDVKPGTRMSRLNFFATVHDRYSAPWGIGWSPILCLCGCC